MMTISHIFSALMECRSYKAPLLADAAYKIMRDRRGNLDIALVKAFGEVG
jgi:HD-GYP domain-containing protein (c-di-GMP phosphodiesterase class II)